MDCEMYDVFFISKFSYSGIPDRHFSGSPGSKRTATTTFPKEYPLAEAHKRFIVAILGDRPGTELQPICDWYIGFLKSKITKAWGTLFSPVLRDADNPFVNLLCDQAPPIAFIILETIVLELRRENLALTDVVDKLYNNKMLKETDDDRSHANQLVFACLAWMSGSF
jgi:hypothetical protein